MNEFSMIEKYFAPLSRDGLKDDAAVLQIPAGFELVVSSDTLNAGTHFLADAAPGDVAHKALRSNLSDLASMGAAPLSYQLNLAFPEKPSEKFLAEFTSALAADQKEFGIFCSGGDTTSIKGPLSISITVLGLVKTGTALRRGGAKAEDDIILTGPVGDALIGLKILRGEIKTSDDEYFIQKYYRPRPRLDLVASLITSAHAAVDISDGLIADLSHICTASGVQAHVTVSESLFSAAAQKLLQARQVTMVDLLTGGDDYELLAALPPGVALPPGCQSIGRFHAGAPDVQAVDKAGKPITFSHTGWAHF